MTVLQDYAGGRLSARQAACRLGPLATEHDLFQAMIDHRIAIPVPPRDVIDSEVKALRCLFQAIGSRGRP